MAGRKVGKDGGGGEEGGLGGGRGGGEVHLARWRCTSWQEGSWVGQGGGRVDSLMYISTQKDSKVYIDAPEGSSMYIGPQGILAFHIHPRCTLEPT